MRLVFVRTGAVLLALQAGACANLEARKVPLADRLAGCDHAFNGFRYYLSRPYVVVSARVDLAYNYSLGVVVPLMNVNNDGKPSQVAVGVRSLLPDPQSKRHALFDMVGRPLQLASPGQTGWAVIPENNIQLTSLWQELSQGQKDKIQEMIVAATSQLSKSQQVQVSQMIQTQLASLGTRSTVSPSTIVNLLDGGAPADPPAVKPDTFQIVNLPDFEQQIAIRDRNFLAYSKYELNFADGWQLGAVKGSWDSTEVAVRMLQSISGAINAATSIRKKALTTLPITSQEIAASGLGGKSKDADTRAVALVLLTTTEFIPPGMYRLQKPSEMTCGENAGKAFLTELGLPTETDSKVQLVKESVVAQP